MKNLVVDLGMTKDGIMDQMIVVGITEEEVVIFNEEILDVEEIIIQTMVQKIFTMLEIDIGMRVATIEVTIINDEMIGILIDRVEVGVPSMTEHLL
mgnify:FL=1